MLSELIVSTTVTLLCFVLALYLYMKLFTVALTSYNQFCLTTILNTEGITELEPESKIQV